MFCRRQFAYLTLTDFGLTCSCLQISLSLTQTGELLLSAITTSGNGNGVYLGQTGQGGRVT